MARSSSERLRFTNDEFINALCKMCTYPDNPDVVCVHRREDRIICRKCLSIGSNTCRQTSLENHSIFGGY